MELSRLVEIADVERRSRTELQVRCCVAAGCESAGSQSVLSELRTQVEREGLAKRVQVSAVGCMRLCSRGPLVQVDPHGPLYQNVSARQAPSIVTGLTGGQAAAQHGDRNSPFFKLQASVILENCGRIEPERVESYVVAGGYQALHRAVREMSPAQVIDAITRSGLRGRGGAGYPTGVKWATVAKNPGERKFVVCNADEGDPGAFMNRSVLESDPHRVLEGMAIAGHAVGATQGFVYVRGEYVLALHRLQIAIAQATKLGVLGAGIFGTPFDFRIDLRLGAGAYVCGEETAMMASIMGGRGTPTPRPPYPAERGLWGMPTLLNNVETFANIAAIIRKGPEWFAAIGTPMSPGTKVFCVTGKVANMGLVEVPLGTPIRTIVEDIAGGVPDGRVKAVQTGGPSGGCVPAELLDTPADYDSLRKVGSIMGSGGMIVMDETSDMVDVARYFMEFSMDESCGKCVPCRAGTVQLHRLLTRIRDGSAGPEELARLESLCHMVQDTSLCGLGQAAPNPTLSTLQHFRREYEAKLSAAPRSTRLQLPVVAPTPHPMAGAGRNPVPGPIDVNSGVTK